MSHVRDTPEAVLIKSPPREEEMISENCKHADRGHPCAQGRLRPAHAPAAPPPPRQDHTDVAVASHPFLSGSHTPPAHGCARQAHTCSKRAVFCFYFPFKGLETPLYSLGVVCVCFSGVAGKGVGGGTARRLWTAGSRGGRPARPGLSHVPIWAKALVCRSELSETPQTSPRVSS